MLSRATIHHDVAAILQARNPRITLTPGMPLGAEGLGLDSIAIVEVLLECEERFGVVLAAELLSSPNLTVDALLERVRVLVET